MPLSSSTRRAHRTPRSRFAWLGLTVLSLIALVVPAGASAHFFHRSAADIQILNVSDWHGNLDPASANGGAWNISARWQEDRKAMPTLTLTAGDDFGAAPPLSGFFDEAPAIQAQRLMGIQINTFGNHNFDKGVAHLQSMIDLARARSTGSAGDHPGKPFKYVAANLSNIKANLKHVAPFEIIKVGKVSVAVIGIVNEEAPTLVSPGNFGTMTVTDGVAAAKKYARLSRLLGADVVVVITHKGMNTVSPPTGNLVDFANAMPKGLVDVVIGDHTNIQFSGTTPKGVLYHENLSYGNGYARTRLNVTPGFFGHVNSKSVEFVVPGPSGSLGSNRTSCLGGTITTGTPPVVVPDPAPFCDQKIVDMLVPYRNELAVQLDGVIGTTLGVFDRGDNVERRKEVPLGDLIADSMRIGYGVDIGFMTGGGIRSQFPACGYTPQNLGLHRSNFDNSTAGGPWHVNVVTCPGGYASGGPYDLVKGDVYTVLPFGNNIVTRSVTGLQLWQALENGVSKCPNPLTAAGTCAGRFPQVSGIKFTFDVSKTSGCSGSEVAPITWSCTINNPPTGRVTVVTKSDGTPIAPDGTTYTFAVTDFTNNGGDSFFMLADGQGASRDRDANAFLSYLSTLSFPIDPASFTPDRITCLPACTP